MTFQPNHHDLKRKVSHKIDVDSLNSATAGGDSSSLTGLDSDVLLEASNSSPGKAGGESTRREFIVEDDGDDYLSDASLSSSKNRDEPTPAAEDDIQVCTITQT